MSFALNWIAFKTILRKEVTRFLRIWSQTLLPPVINQSLYFIIFGGFIGSQISDIQGIPYMSFIVPGLVMMAVITSSYMNVSSSFFSTKFMRSIEELMVSPTSDWVIVWGYTLGGALRGLIVGSLVFLISFIFVQPQIHNILFILVFVLLTSIVFSLGGLLNGIFAKKFDDISLIPTFVITPLTYFGGVFYSIERLPEFWEKLSRFNPILYMVDGFRYGFYGIADVNVWVSMGLLIILTLILIIMNLWFLERGTGMRN